MSVDDAQSGSKHGPDRSGGGGRSMRLAATLVLIPTVPMLLFSIAALGLFYIAPGRFGNFISRLPGEVFIRTALVFAPATLFAVIVLAVLYALEKPEEGIPTEGPETRQAPLGIEESIEIIMPPARRAARLVFIFAVPALLFSAAVWAVSFVAPGRFNRIVGSLQNEPLLRPLVNLVPPVLLIVVLVTAFLTFSSPQARRKAEMLRIAVSAVLVAAVPSLLASLAALLLSHFSPGRFERLMDRLPYEEFVRVVLAFAPVVLLGVVLLASLFLRGRPTDDSLAEEQDRLVQYVEGGSPERRALIALWTLIGGLTVTAVLVVGLLAAVLYLVYR
jgi:hypothetical protein